MLGGEMLTIAEEMIWYLEVLVWRVGRVGEAYIVL